MPRFQVATPQRTYPVMVERGVLSQAAEFLPASGGKFFVVTTEDVWRLHGAPLEAALRGRDFSLLFFVGGEENKRLAHVERMAGQMAEGGGDRSSTVLAFGGGIVNDMGGFLAAIFMRGVPVLQIPTTLLAQVDAAVGGKTGTNLVAGKNLVGAFHQPLAVLIDPAVLDTLPEREYRAGLFEIIKHGVIADPELFDYLVAHRRQVLAMEPDAVDRIVADSVRLKAEVVSNDERESGLRRILNFGHTFGHALEAETRYTRFLHGEAVGWGMRAATYLARDMALLPQGEAARICDLLDKYGPVPSTEGLAAGSLRDQLIKDKKTIQGKLHFVLPVAIGKVTVRSDAAGEQVLRAIDEALASCR